MPDKQSWSLRDKLHLRRPKPRIMDENSNRQSNSQVISPGTNTSGSGSAASTRPLQKAQASPTPLKGPNSTILPSRSLVSPVSASQLHAGDADPVITDDASRPTKTRAIDIPPELLWDQAYDDLKKDDPALIKSYETILSLELGNSRSSSENVIQETRAGRRSQMENLLKVGLERTAKLSKVERGIGRAISVVTSVKSAIGSGLSAVPVAAVVWTSVCVALEVSRS